MERVALKYMGKQETESKRLLGQSDDHLGLSPQLSNESYTRILMIIYSSTTLRILHKA